MLPEAESINKDGSQDGLMEAANIPLQSKEEDQMWKILNTDERCLKPVWSILDSFNIHQSFQFNSLHVSHGAGVLKPKM